MAYYVGGVGLVTLLASYCLMLQARMLDAHGWRLVAITGLFVICASQLGVALMNWLSTLLVQPRLLPRLDSSAGIAAEWRTMVVVPTMLTSEGGIDRLVAEETGLPVHIADDPLSAVAEGTGRVLQELQFLKRVASSKS